MIGKGKKKVALATKKSDNKLNLCVSQTENTRQNAKKKQQQHTRKQNRRIKNQ